MPSNQALDESLQPGLAGAGRETARAPRAMGFQLVANDKGLRERYTCFATERDVSSDLSGTVTGTDFENLSIASIDQVRAAFHAASRGKIADGYFNVEFK